MILSGGGAAGGTRARAQRGRDRDMRANIRFWLGLCPRPCWGAYSTPQTSYLDLREGGKGRRRKG